MERFITKVYFIAGGLSEIQCFSCRPNVEAQKNLPSTKTESDKKIYRQKAEILDKQIDSLVYELYGLSEEEIFVVEGGV